jgi:O-antigen/teichoic acid export membrane protein
LLFSSLEYTAYIQAAVLIIPFATFVTLFLDVARLVRLPLRYLTIAVGNLLLTTVLIVAAVVGLGLGLTGVLWGTLLGNVSFSLIGWWLTRPQYTWRFSSAMLRRLLMLGLPLVPASLAFWVINFSNRWFLAGINSLDQVAVYALATKLCAPVVLIVTAFQIAWVPFSLSIARDTAAEPVYARTLLYFLAVTFAALLGLTLFAEPLILIFATPVYLPAAQVLALVGLSSIASGAYYIVATGVTLTGRMVHIGWTTIVAALVNIALNLALIPPLGIVGAAVAGLVANCIPVVLLYIVAQRLHYVPYDLPRVVLLAGTSAAFLGAATLIHVSPPMLDVAGRVVLLFGFGAALLLLGVIRLRDLTELRRLAVRAVRRGAGA